VLPTFAADPTGIAGRDSSGQVLNAPAQAVPWVFGGSADLSPSTKTNLTFSGAGDFQADDRSGRNLHFGTREHAATAITNGMALTKLCVGGEPGTNGQHNFSATEPALGHDSSTNALIRHYRTLKD
jgi:transketolase